MVVPQPDMRAGGAQGASRGSGATSSNFMMNAGPAGSRNGGYPQSMFNRTGGNAQTPSGTTDYYQLRMGPMNAVVGASGRGGPPGGGHSGMYGVMGGSGGAGGGNLEDMNRRRMYQPYFGRRGGGPQHGGYSYRGGRGGRGGGVGGYGGPRRVIGELAAQPNQTLKSQVEQAFDFDESNRKFEKKEKSATESPTEGKENENAASVSTATVVYDKKTSFFDRISCDALDRQAGQEARVDRAKLRQLDMETFGATAAAPMRRGGSNYRRRGNYGGYYHHGHGGGGGMMNYPGFQYAATATAGGRY